MGCILAYFVREHRRKRHLGVWCLKFQVDLQYFVRALTVIDYLRIRRRIVNSLLEASNIKHLRSSGLLPGMGSELVTDVLDNISVTIPRDKQSRNKAGDLWRPQYTG
jgi:hypothetical protein